MAHAKQTRRGMTAAFIVLVKYKYGISDLLSRLWDIRSRTRGNNYAYVRLYAVAFIDVTNANKGK